MIRLIFFVDYFSISYKPTSNISITCRAATPAEANAILVHNAMFIPTIEKQGTDEQKAKWLPLTRDLRIIGTYAQTELGHGKMYVRVRCKTTKYIHF
jgi:alkylation response protein AidB-like acyl-CoA dehydrogenase